ncbi:MAG: synthase subunit delta [Pseudomonadota bacterium]|jgi:F-type H+-transporting ATPase subunit delta
MSQFTTHARPYARAAFETAIGDGSLRTWSAALGLLAALLRDTKVAGYLSDPSRNTGEQGQTLIDLGGSELDAKVQNFVLILAANKRLTLLADIAALFEGLKAEYEKTVDVEVISAFGMDQAAENNLVAALKKRLQRDVKLNISVDRALIGGMIVRAGDLVIDGSVRGRLNKLAESIN